MIYKLSYISGLILFSIIFDFTTKVVVFSKVLYISDNCFLYNFTARRSQIILPDVCGCLEWCIISGGSGQTPLFLSILLTELTEGILWGSQTLWCTSCSLISHANIPGFSCLKRSIFLTTVGVATCCRKNFIALATFIMH